MEVSPGTPTEASVVLFYHRSIVASIFIGAAIIGLFGNTLIIISVLIEKKLRTITNILVVNLALADFLTCSCLPFQVVALLSQTRSYPLHEIVCATVAGVIHSSVFCSVLTLVTIAFVRWYVITRSIRGHQGLHTPKKIVGLMVIIWIGSVAGMVVPPALGIGTLGYSVYYSTCSLTDANPLEFYYVLFQGIVFSIALILTLTFYGLILRHVLRHNKQFREKFAVDEGQPSSSTEGHGKASSSASPNSRPPMIKAINAKEVEITKNLFMVVCVFTVCFLANSVNFLIPGTSVFTLYSVMILLANSMVNPIIYGLKHPNFKEAFKRILCPCRLKLLQVPT